MFPVIPSHQDTKRFCYNWIRQENKLNVSDDVPPCPCTLQQAKMDIVRYQPDPDCNSLVDNKDPDLNCLYRANARHCIRLSKPGYVSICNLKKKKNKSCNMCLLFYPPCIPSLNILKVALSKVTVNAHVAFNQILKGLKFCSR